MKKLFGIVLLMLGACVFAQALTRVEFFEKVKENFEIENYEEVLNLSDTMLLQKMSKTQEAEIDYVKAQAYYMLNRFDLALEYAEKSLEIQKKSPDVHDLKGQIFIALYKKNDDSENLKKAIVAFDESLKINQRFLGSHLYRGLARYYLFSSRYSELSDDENIELIVNAYKDFCDEALLRPDYMVPHYFQSKINIITKRFQPAIESLTECLKLQPDFAGAYFMRAFCHLASKETFDIGEVYNDLKKMVGVLETGKYCTTSFELKDTLDDEGKMLLANGYYTLSVLDNLVQDYDESLSFINSALTLEPNNKDFLLARCHLFYTLAAVEKDVSKQKDYKKSAERDRKKLESLGEQVVIKNSEYDNLALYQKLLEVVSNYALSDKN